MSVESVVIIGASHAASELVPALRKAGWKGRLTLIGDEPMLPYHRPPLSKGYLQGDVSEEKLLIRRDTVYQDANVDLRLGEVATRIDRESKEVELKTGERIAYSKLVIATGARARAIPIEGADLPQVHSLRSIADVNKIRSHFEAGSKLLIVGAGYIGLEVAASAIKQGMDVTVLEAQDRVLARVTSPEVSEFYQKIHREEGVDIRLGESLERFSSEDNRCQAHLSSGEIIDFNCAIVGIGVVPNVELAEEAGLKCDNGIVVDEFCRSSDSNIYAVGDVSNHYNQHYGAQLRLESVPNALGQAKTAALSICGKGKPYTDLPWFWSDQYDIKLQTAGLMQGYDQAVVRGEPESKSFSVYYLRESELIAVDAINSPIDFMLSKKVIPSRLKPDAKSLADASISIKEILALD